MFRKCKRYDRTCQATSAPGRQHVLTRVPFASQRVLLLPPTGAPRRDTNRYLLAATLAGSVASLPIFLIGSLAVQIRASLHFGTSTLGISVGLYYLGAAAASLPAGRLAERLGALRVARLITLVFAALLSAVALFARSLVALDGLLILAGVLGGGIQPALNLLLAQRVRRERQGWAFGVKQSAAPFASALGGAAVPVIGVTLGWRYAFALAAGVALAAFAATTAPTARAQQPHQKAELATLPLTALLPLAAGFGIAMFAILGASAFLVSFAVASGIATGTAGLIAASASVLTIIVRVLSGRRADQRGQRHLPAVAVMIMLGGAGFILLFLAATTDTRWLVVTGALLVLGVGWGWNGLFALAIVRSCPAAPARATAVTQVGARLGGVLGPLATGFVIQHMSYGTAWVLCASLMLIASLTVIVGRSFLLNTKAHDNKPSLSE